MQLPHPLAALPLFTLTALAAPADWPRWRGANRDGRLYLRDQDALMAYELRKK